MINEVKGAQQTAIQNLSNNQQADKAENQVHHAERKEKQSSSGPAHEVSLTDTAAKLRQLEAQIANQPVVDTQRVESVKKAISDGSFKVDSNRIADKMAAFESLLQSKSADK
jgi:negative regulator of flagellin synthesis FlgM